MSGPGLLRRWFSPAPPEEAERAVGLWLLLCAGLVGLMVIIGGLTRLTDSGLSMVEWKPLTGFIPPLGETQWSDLFEKYKQFPEYQRVNGGMDLEGFKGIFWLEFIHRVLGRLIGLTFALPFLAFLITRRIPPRSAPRYGFLFILGGLQGLLGWYMVKSGLISHPDVSHLRLAAHMGLAVVILGALLTHALAHLSPRAPFTHRHPLKGLLLALALIGTTLTLGAFVAGTNAGQMYNTFPLMNGQWIPDGILTLDPWWLNAFENIITIQFLHRWIALLTVAVVIAVGLRVLRDGPPGAHLPARLMIAAVLVQATLGLATLLLVVPLALASAHQTGAIVLVTLTLWATWESHRPPARPRKQTQPPIQMEYGKRPI
ncbi:MAG: COX15/CtaA family protein [Rhodospirillum sp.]|nr:COX15/CtaA family protein [Rhodospirillum sp.]MCF8489372.1 COX15/CtaA family protein [Rhodospirillum sp.]MCF8501728.1 COX15/CtaA family protein [Rhodospirillum sp.]